jgi:hypothetical protein
MAEEKQYQEVKRLEVDLKDLTVEAYTKSFMAYRISLENWFLLNELLAYVKNEKLTSREIQARLGKLFEVVNGEVLKEFVRLHQAREAAESLPGAEESESENESKVEEKAEESTAAADTAEEKEDNE